jgi:CVNH domain
MVIRGTQPSVVKPVDFTGSIQRCIQGILREANVKAHLGLFAVAALAGLAIPAFAQAPPPGSYQRTCRDIRMQGTILSAVCIREHGRGEQLTALNVTRCVGDIRNLNGQLQCAGGHPVPPPAPGGPSAYPGPGYSPTPGYGPPPGYERGERWREEQAFRERCERLEGAEHEIRDRLAYTPYGEERERLQYRLGEIHQERERCWRR